MPAQPKEILETILGSLGFVATVEEKNQDGDLTLDVKTEEAGRLIGRQGQTLADLQYLVNRILFQGDQHAPKVMLDVGGYRSQAREALIKKAMEAAEKVRRWGDAVELEPWAPMIAALYTTHCGMIRTWRPTVWKWTAAKRKR